MEPLKLGAKAQVKPNSREGHTGETGITAAVLCGGASSRFGRDKATYKHRGISLAEIALNALQEAGVSEVLSVGGDAAALSGMGFHAVPDDYPGEGPLGGVISALRHASGLAGICIVLSCDLPWASAATVQEVVEALASHPNANVVFPIGEKGIPQYLHGAWRLCCLSQLEAAFAQGGRSIRDSFAMLAEDSVHLCHVSDKSSLLDLDEMPK